MHRDELRKFAIGDRVRKHSGSWWEGRVVGFYGTSQTAIGYNVQLDMVPNGPVQIYPEAALEPAAALSEQTLPVRVEIKPLEWRQLYPEHTLWPKDWHGTGVQRARYVVTQSYASGEFYVCGRGFSSLEEAKLHADSDYATAILSALVDVPAVESEPERTIPRANNCGRYLAEVNDGKLLYLNHADQWQECPNFIRAALADAAAADGEPLAWQWRSRIKGGAWDSWETGRYGQQVPPFMDVQERALYAHPPALRSSGSAEVGSASTSKGISDADD